MLVSITLPVIFLPRKRLYWSILLCYLWALLYLVVQYSQGPWLQDKMDNLSGGEEKKIQHSVITACIIYMTSNTLNLISFPSTNLIELSSSITHLCYTTERQMSHIILNVLSLFFQKIFGLIDSRAELIFSQTKFPVLVQWIMYPWGWGMSHIHLYEDHNQVLV